MVQWLDDRLSKKYAHWIMITNGPWHIHRARRGPEIKLPDDQKMKVGIIGGGLAGMITAMDLSEAGHEVEIFEARPFMGGKASAFFSSFFCYSNTLPPSPMFFVSRVYVQLVDGDLHRIACSQIWYGSIFVAYRRESTVAQPLSN